MEDVLPPFLVRLGLDLQADERAVRRAYARLLKQIDQEADPNGFQSLREAYEVALFWIEQKRQQASDLAGDQPSASVGEAREAEATQLQGKGHPDHAQNLGIADRSDRVPSDPEPRSASNGTAQATQYASRASEQAAHSVLDELQAKLASGWPQDRAAVRAWLDGILDADRLVDMDARFYFEWGVAGVLAEGWKPGKEHLFGPAIDRFGWKDDRGRLAAFQRAGGIVDAAIAQLEFFDGLPDRVRTAQRDLIRRLRDDKRPSTSALLAQMPLVEHISQLYPHWLHLITNAENIGRWREWAGQIPKWRKRLARQPRPVRTPSQPNSGGRRYGWVFLALLAFGALIRIFDSSPSRSPAPAATPVGRGVSMGPRPPIPSGDLPGRVNSAIEGLLQGTPAANPSAQGLPSGPKPLPLGAGAPSNERPAVGAAYLAPPKLIYPAVARRLGQQGRVILMVVVEADGKVRRAQVEASSGHAALDEAATAAVLGATFVPARDSSGKAIASRYRIPFEFKLSDGPGPANWKPRSYAEAVRDTVLPYIIFGDPVSGNPAAEITLKLAEDGRIEQHKLSKSSGNKAWDSAVLRAIERVPRLPADQSGKVPSQLVIAFRPKA